MEKIQSRSERYLRLPNLPLAFHFSHYPPSHHRNSPAVLPLSPQQYQLFKELLTIIANMAGSSTHAQNYCSNLLATGEIKKNKNKKIHSELIFWCLSSNCQNLDFLQASKYNIICYLLQELYSHK